MANTSPRRFLKKVTSSIHQKFAALSGLYTNIVGRTDCGIWQAPEAVPMIIERGVMDLICIQHHYGHENGHDEQAFWEPVLSTTCRRATIDGVVGLFLQKEWIWVSHVLMVPLGVF